METPICDFVKAYTERDPLRLHMPGHKGVGFLGAEAMDITEIEGADVLYRAEGIIKRSEENAATLFGTARTLYSAEGSSLAIRAMLFLTALYGRAKGRRTLVAAGRNAHKVFVTAAALLDMELDWLFPGESGSILSCQITGEMLEEYLSAAEEKPLAVYVTSPDYLGNVADIAALSRVCRRHEVLLLVDNAHGAYLHFLPESRHPIALGADLCCDSAHKTLPVLTGGAYLHVSRSAPALFSAQAENAMSLFASTSPSYLILQSLDMANRYLAEGYRERLQGFAGKVSALKSRLAAAGYTLVGTEPLKLTIEAKPFGYTGRELAERLAAQNMVCEFSDPDYTVMMLTPECGENALARIGEVLLALDRKPPIPERMPPMTRPVKILSLREALFSPCREESTHACPGKVLASPTVGCPPAVPIVVCGERIDEAAIRLLDYYGIESCCVTEKE